MIFQRVFPNIFPVFLRQQLKNLSSSRLLLIYSSFFHNLSSVFVGICKFLSSPMNKTPHSNTELNHNCCLLSPQLALPLPSPSPLPLPIFNCYFDCHSLNWRTGSVFSPEREICIFSSPRRRRRRHLSLSD